jgi:hypothetical protein
MKICTVVLALGFVLSTGCATEDESLLLDRLTGTWTWTGSSGGIAGEIVEPEEDGQARTIEITADREVVFRTAEVETRRAAFEFVEVKSVLSGKNELAMRLSDDGMTWIVRLNEDDRLLALSENVYDGYSHSCRRD